MNVAIVLVTHNRLEYTSKALPRLLEDPNEEFDLYLWDNASTDETPEYLKYGVKDPRIAEVVINKENAGPLGAMNYAWSKTKAELVGKIDNDCLVTPGWTRVFAKAHEDIERLGAVACWHYFLDEFDENSARKVGKIQEVDGHYIVRHPWVCGSGFILKRSTYEKYGPWKEGCNVGTTKLFLKIALGGEINGWYYPLVLQEHMDDPRSKHSLVTDDESLCKMYNTTYTLRTKRIKDIKSRWERRKKVLSNLNEGPWEAEFYMNRPAKFWRRLKHLMHMHRFLRKFTTEFVL